MKTNRQVEIFLFKRKGVEILFLMLKRNPYKGGFWQPITGGVEQGESETEAALREIQEETGITPRNQLVVTKYTFTFKDGEKTLHETVFGLEVSEQDIITLSPEHTHFIWVSYQDALDHYLTWPGNKEGLKDLLQIINPPAYL